jgi:mannose-6-phosphate isomerase
VDVLQPVIRPYAWGSREAIAELQGRPVPSPGPEAELWMGAHPSAPSVVVRDGRSIGLDAVIAADPVRELGAACAERFGGRLPFLLKVLAARQALSIQVHPSRAQAQVGFAADNARGLAPGDPARNYVDDWPKPELLYALTPFEVLAGLRTPADALAFLRTLGVDRLRTAGVELALAQAAADGTVGGADAVGGGAADGRGTVGGAGAVGGGAADGRGRDGGADAVGCALATILSWPAGDRAALVAGMVAAYARVAEGSSHYAPACAALLRVVGDHPGDVGVAAAALLRYAVLRPGEAVFMPAGGLHAYLRGTGIELLANSDNVVRAGLTGKHIDVPELLKLLDPAVAVPVVQPVALGDGVMSYQTPAPEFRLYQIELGPDAVALPGGGPRLLLCLEGPVALRSTAGEAAGETVKLGRGESCFASAADGDIAGTGPGQVYLASVGAGSAGAN